MKESQNKLICGSDKKANTQLAIAITDRKQAFKNSKLRIKKERNPPKGVIFITTIKHSKTHYKGKSVIQSLLISRKRIKRERSMPKGVISRLYISNIIQLVTVVANSQASNSNTKQPYVRTYVCKTKKPVRNHECEH